jgi:hypothetical protein
LVNRLRENFGTPGEHRFLALIGASGSGKSSLALAGLIPAIAWGELPDSNAWPVVRMRPGTNPWESLQIALASNEQITRHLAAVPALITRPEDEQRRLHLTASIALHERPGSHRLFDQFEETFTLCQDETARAKFIDNILWAMSAAGGRTIVVLTMRSDFYSKCPNSEPRTNKSHRETSDNDFGWKKIATGTLEIGTGIINRNVGGEKIHRETTNNKFGRRHNVPGCSSIATGTGEFRLGGRKTP